LIFSALNDVCRADRNQINEYQKASLILVKKKTWQQIAPRLVETIRTCIKD